MMWETEIQTPGY